MPLFEQNLSIRVNEVQLTEAKKFTATVCLKLPKLCSTGYKVSKSAQLTFMVVKTGDVIYGLGSALLVHACAESEGAIELLVEPHVFLRYDMYQKARVYKILYYFAFQTRRFLQSFQHQVQL